MAVTVAITVGRDIIVCPGCGAKRVVTQRQRRRHAARERGIACNACRGIASTRPFRDSDLRFWLNAFGVRCCPPGVTARALIASGQAPRELVELAHTIWPVQ